MKAIQAYNDSLLAGDREIANTLSREINRHLPEAESKIWHRHPVWFLDGNPIVGYCKLKRFCSPAFLERTIICGKRFAARRQLQSGRGPLYFSGPD